MQRNKETSNLTLTASSSSTFFESNKQADDPNAQLLGFLQHVADGNLQSAETILKSAKDPSLLRAFLSTEKSITQTNGLTVTGTALEIAIRLFDCSTGKGAPEGMMEMLMRYMRMLNSPQLQSGEQLIEASVRKLFKNDLHAHFEHQKVQAQLFVDKIIEPLAETIKNGKDQEIINAMYIGQIDDITDINDIAHFDNFIETTLKTNPFWQKLLKHDANIAQFMKKDDIYNPLYLEKVYEKLIEKCRNDFYDNKKVLGFVHEKEYISLLATHALGSIQVHGPNVIGMLFTRNANLKALYENPEFDLSQFAIERDISIEDNQGELFSKSAENGFFISKAGWIDLGNLIHGWTSRVTYRHSECIENRLSALQSIRKAKETNLHDTLRNYFAPSNDNDDNDDNDFKALGNSM